jgi:hypothetical protein
VAALLRRRQHSVAGSAPVGWPIAQIIVAVAVVASSTSSGARTPASVPVRWGLPPASALILLATPGLLLALPLVLVLLVAILLGRLGSALAGVLVAARRPGQSLRKSRTGALPLVQRWRKLRHPYWSISCFSERKNPDRCLGCPSRATFDSPGERRMPPEPPALSASTRPVDCWPPPVELAFRALAALLSSPSARGILGHLRAARPR